MSVRIVAAALFGAFLIFHPASAQVNVGRISGTVTDASGAAVGGAQVVVSSQATQTERKATTDHQGFYVVVNLPVGGYDVKVEAKGFRVFERTGIDLPDDGRITADFKLEVGAVSSLLKSRLKWARQSILSRAS
jgi:hypothetical protein